MVLDLYGLFGLVLFGCGTTKSYGIMYYEQFGKFGPCWMCNRCTIWDYIFLKGIFRSDVDAIYFVDWLTIHSIKHIDQITMVVVPCSACRVV